MDNARDALRDGVVGVVEDQVDLVLGYVGKIIDGEVVGYGGENDDGANENGGKKT